MGRTQQMLYADVGGVWIIQRKTVERYAVGGELNAESVRELTVQPS